MKKYYNNIVSFFCANKVILIVMLMLFIERIAALYELGIMYSLESDDLSYVNSGIYFANTGKITMHDNYPSAQIMPGMTVFIGFISLVFGEQKLLWLVLKLLWIFMGCMTAWYVYKSVKLFVPSWCGVVTSLFLFRPDFAWMDNIILTETPFMLSLTAMVYYTLRMGQENNYKNFWGCLVAYMTGLMLKANIAPYPIFVLVYLLIIKYDKKLLLKQSLILVSVVLCFVIPWSVRNYIHFDSFIPLTYGAGNPTLLGTYQGINYPEDDTLDYDENVTNVVKHEYSKYYDEKGNVLPQYKRYVSLQKDGIKAKYRQKVWCQRDIKSMLYSYGVLKPQKMINSIFYWKPVFNINSSLLSRLPYLEILCCFFTVFAAIALKKCCAPIFFTFLVYIGNIYIYAMTFSFDRYNASLVSIKYIVMGIGVGLFIKTLAHVLNYEISGKKSPVICSKNIN